MDMFNAGYYTPLECKEFIAHNARKITQLENKLKEYGNSESN